MPTQQLFQCIHRGILQIPRRKGQGTFKDPSPYTITVPPQDIPWTLISSTLYTKKSTINPEQLRKPCSSMSRILHSTEIWASTNYHTYETALTCITNVPAQANTTANHHSQHIKSPTGTPTHSLPYHHHSPLPLSI